MNMFTIFFYKILTKYSPKRTTLPHFKKIFEGACPRSPLANAWPSHALHGASRYANTPTFPKTF